MKLKAENIFPTTEDWYDGEEEDYRNSVIDYTINDLATILVQMGDYLEENEGQGYEDEFKSLFHKLVSTGLFHDACGKIIDEKDGVYTVTTRY